MRSYKRLTASLLLCWGASSVVPAMAQTGLEKEVNKTRPNIVFILSDDAGYGDFGFQGSQQMHTPNIDAIADAGVTFNKAYVSAPVCAPSRAGLLTGRYQQRFSFEKNLTRPEDKVHGMAQGEKTIGDHFQAGDYETAAIGKWHVGSLDKYHPNNRGFDYFYGLLEGARSYFDQTVKTEKDKFRVLERNGVIVEQPNQGYTTDILTDDALNFIDTNKDKPFMVYLSYNAVHTPMDAKREDLAKVSRDIKDPKRRKLVAMTASLDENVGRVTKKLDDLGLTDNTMVIFLNDNGGSTHNASDNRELRGSKGSTFEGGIRVPFAIKWPGHIKAGSQFDERVIALDILPTMLAASDLEPVANTPKLDGVNLLPYLSGELTAAPHESLYFKFWSGRAHIKGDWKWGKMKVKEDGKKVLKTFLFNLKDDPSEKVNLLDVNKDKATELSNEWKAWHAQMPEPWSML